MNKQVNRRRLAVIAAVILIFLAAGSVVYAEFIKSSRAKRVIATYGDEGSLYSSNYLLANRDPSLNVYRRLIYQADGATTANGDVTVCNYAQGNPSKVNGEDITYRLTATLMVLSEANGAYVKTPATSAEVGVHSVKIRLNGGAQQTLSSSVLTYTFPDQILDHRATSTHICSLEFDGAFKEERALCLYLSAVPVNPPPGVHTLDAVFSVVENSDELRNSWTGEFNEKSYAEAPRQPNFDGFNYVVSGMGSGTCVLSWDNTKLRISQVFLVQNGFTAVDSGTQTSVTFAVDSDLVNRYDLQFYYADETVSFASWSELSGTVTLTYTES